MAKDIQIKYINENKEWEELYPATKQRLVTNDSGQTLDQVLTLKADKNQTYTKTETDSLINDLNDTIGNIETFDIPVQEKEPVNEDTKFWFEII